MEDEIKRQGEIKMGICIIYLMIVLIAFGVFELKIIKYASSMNLWTNNLLIIYYVLVHNILYDPNASG